MALYGANDSSGLEACPTGQGAVAGTYRARLAGLQRTEHSLQRRHIWLGYIRLVFGVAFIVLLFPPRFYAWLALAAFAIAAATHDRLLRRLAAVRRTITFYQHAISRTEDRWSGLRPRATPSAAASSLYAADLDLFGPGSVFELLCETRTSLGEETLAGWLLAKSPVDILLQRQEAVKDLCPRLHLREALAGAPGPSTSVLDVEDLSTWAETSSNNLPILLRWVAPTLAVLTLLAAWLALHQHSFLPIAPMLVIDASAAFFTQRTCRDLFAGIEQTQRALLTVAAAMPVLAAEDFAAARLQGLVTALGHGKGGAAHAFAQLARLSQWAEARRNYLVRLLDVPLLFSLQLALAVQAWRRCNGLHLRTWLQTVAEFEALLSLAAYSFEHPEDPFPQFVDHPAQFTATGLGHPLLPWRTCVRNDVALSSEGAQLLLISGSNMSGKSTLLRSIGVNTVLALAGAPVRAQALRLAPLSLAASIQVSDSLQAGQSKFYAEILRLRSITETARACPPVLFLADELLAGTNSSDRLAGAQGFAEGLLRLGAIGLLSTHDLALTALAASHSGVHNAHFEDQIGDDDRLRFDYKLRNGVLQRSNGLALMRLIGLKV